MVPKQVRQKAKYWWSIYIKLIGRSLISFSLLFVTAFIFYALTKVVFVVYNCLVVLLFTGCSGRGLYVYR